MELSQIKEAGKTALSKADTAADKIEGGIVGLANAISASSLAEQERLKDPTYKKVYAAADEVAKNFGFAILIITIITPFLGAMGNLFNAGINKETWIAMTISIMVNVVGNTIAGLLNRRAARHGVYMVSRRAYDITNSEARIESENLNNQLATLQKENEQLKSQLANYERDLTELANFRVEAAARSINQANNEQLERYRIEEAVRARITELEANKDKSEQ